MKTLKSIIISIFSLFFFNNLIAQEDIFWVQKLIKNEIKYYKIGYHFTDIETIDKSNHVLTYFKTYYDFNKTNFISNDSLSIHFKNDVFNCEYDIGLNTKLKYPDFYISNLKFYNLDKENLPRFYATINMFKYYIDENITSFVHSFSLEKKASLKEMLSINYTHGTYTNSYAPICSSMLDPYHQSICVTCHETLKLSKTDLNSIIVCFLDSNILAQNYSDCEFNPHDGIMIYNDKKLVAYLEICFECGEIRFNNLENKSTRVKTLTFENFARSKNAILMNGEQKVRGKYQENIKKEIENLELELKNLKLKAQF